MGTRLERHPATARFGTVRDGITSWHAFSYGQHYDPANVGFGLLVAHNDELLAPGAGYGEHRHRDVEILTWVVSGALRHEDDLGTVSVVTPGMVQLLTAGRGVRHSEHNAAPTDTRYVQMWVVADAEARPAYGTASHAGSGFVTLASGRSDVALALRAPASFAVARLMSGESASLAGGAFVHLSVVRGSVMVELGDDKAAMDDGDTVRIAGAGEIAVRAQCDAEVLGWVMDSALGPPQ